MVVIIVVLVSSLLHVIFSNEGVGHGDILPTPLFRYVHDRSRDLDPPPYHCGLVRPRRVQLEEKDNLDSRGTPVLPNFPHPRLPR
jgi:hypothetical protein